MDKQEYLLLLSEASMNDPSKFPAVPLERPNNKGRPPKYYYALQEKEKLAKSTVHRTLAESVRPTGSTLAQLYGLPKTHKRPHQRCVLYYQLLALTTTPLLNGLMLCLSLCR